MRFYYKFEPGDKLEPLHNVPRDKAETILKGLLRTASRVPGTQEPKAIVLIEDGEEIWRWTQLDRKAS